jgi:hypothetical protein
MIYRIRSKKTIYAFHKYRAEARKWYSPFWEVIGPASNNIGSIKRQIKTHKSIEVKTVRK